ncbi:MAG TPA: glycosyltransferase 87 family protein [Candidatus Limnocylindria bacterium]|nr:glycosyltransferase 87 family protein [Candidatus Limnocylindria bacterium]
MKPPRVPAILLVCVAAWLIGWVTWRSAPAGFDFIAIYASARLVATGNPAAVTDREAIFAVERATLPERTIFLNNANPPALSLILAPIGALPFHVAYAVMLTLGVAALAAAALLVAPLAAPEQRMRLFPFALLAPPSTIALAHGQTTPIMLLVIAASLRAPPAASGALLGLLALRPQLLPLFALIALADRERRVPFLLVAGAVSLVSLLMVGPDGAVRYLDLLAPQAAELRPGELGLAALLRRAGVGAADGALGNIALSTVAVLAAAVLILRTPAGQRMVRAMPAALLAAPHSLLHDAVAVYPAVAARALTTRATVVLIGTGLVAVLVHEAGIPVAPLWLLALLFMRRGS